MKTEKGKKDHVPSSFERDSGYVSDLEYAELRGSYVNTNGRNGHNVYIYENGNHGAHEHFWYDPSTQTSGYHGSQFETKNNRPHAHDTEPVAVENDHTRDSGFSENDHWQNADRISSSSTKGEHQECEDEIAMEDFKGFGDEEHGHNLHGNCNEMMRSDTDEDISEIDNESSGAL